MVPAGTLHVLSQVSAGELDVEQNRLCHVSIAGDWVRRPSRRTIATGAAWAVPVIAVAAAAPAMATSPIDPPSSNSTPKHRASILELVPGVQPWLQPGLQRHRTHDRSVVHQRDPGTERNGRGHSGPDRRRGRQCTCSTIPRVSPGPIVVGTTNSANGTGTFTGSFNGGLARSRPPSRSSAHAKGRSGVTVPADRAVLSCLPTPDTGLQVSTDGFVTQHSTSCALFAHAHSSSRHRRRNGQPVGGDRRRSWRVPRWRRSQSDVRVLGRLPLCLSASAGASSQTRAAPRGG